MKVKILRISFELFKSLLTSGEHRLNYRVIDAAMPDDAEIISCTHSWMYPGMIELMIRSESFDVVPNGCAADVFTPTLQTIQSGELPLKYIPAEEAII